MALTVSTPFASGAINAATGTTITLATGTAASSWVGRAIRLDATLANRGGQWRKITGFTSTTEIEIEYGWRTSLDPSDVDYEELPQNGDAFYVSHKLDDIDDGVNVDKLSLKSYEVLSGLTFDGNTFLFEELKLIDFNNQFGNLRVTTNSAFILGNYNADSLGVNGCLVIGEKPASGFVSVVTANSDGLGGGDFLLHGSTLDFSAGSGSGFYFVRAYRSSRHIARIINCSTFGVFGGRYQGDRSILRDVISAGSESTIGPFTTKTPMTVDGYTVSDSVQAVYWNAPISGSGKILALRAVNISSRLVRFGGTGGSGGGANATLDLVSWDISEADKGGSPNLVLWDDASGRTVYWTSRFNFSADSANGRIAVYNAAILELSNQLSSDGTYDAVEARSRSYAGKTSGTSAFSDGVVLGPFRVELREYGKQFLALSFQGDSDESFSWIKTTNTLNTAADSATALAVTNPTTTDAIYDNSQATYELSGNMQYPVGISAAGVTLSFGLNVTIDSGLSTVTYDLANDAVSYSAIANGTKLTTVSLGANQTLTLVQAGVQSGNWQIPTTGTVVVSTGITDLSTFTFSAGSTLSLASGTATVLVTNNPGIITAGAGTITIQEPTISFTAPNLTSATFDSVRCRLSLVPGGPAQINDDGSVANGAISFLPSDVSTTTNVISVVGITGKLNNSNSVIRFFGSDLPEPLDKRAVYYPSVDYDGTDNLQISTSPGGATLSLTDSGSIPGSGTDLFCSPWTQLDTSLVTSGDYSVNVVSSATTASVTLENNDVIVLQAIHHDTPGASGTPTISNYLEESFSYQGQSISSLSALSLANDAMTLIAEIGLDGSQVTGYSIDAGAPSKIQVDVNKTTIDTRELLAFAKYVQWSSSGMAMLRGNIIVQSLNSIPIRGEVTIDAQARAVMGGPFTYRLDGENIIAPESAQVSFNWENTRAAVITQEVAISLPTDVLGILQSTLYLAAQIPGISSGGSGGSGDATATNQTTMIAHLEQIKGTTFDTATDSLEALRARGDSSWLTASGFSTHSAADIWTVPTRELTSGAYAAIVTAVWSATTRELTSITPAQLDAIATAIEAALINEGDGQPLIDAILQIFNANLDLPALELAAIASAVRSNLATELALIDTAISSRLADATYTVPPDSTAIQSAATAALIEYDPPTRAELTTDISSILTQGNTAWTGVDVSGLATSIEAQAILSRANTLPSLADMEGSAPLTAIADLSSTNSAVAAIASALASVALDAKAAKNLSAASL